MAHEWASNTAVWESDKPQANSAISNDEEMSQAWGQNDGGGGWTCDRPQEQNGVPIDATGSLYEPDEQMGMVVDGILVMPNNAQYTEPALNRSSWGSYLEEQQVITGYETHPPRHQPNTYTAPSKQEDRSEETDWAARLRGPTVSFQQQSLWSLHPNSLRPEDQRPNFFHLRNSRLLAQPGRHRHVVPPDPAALIRRNIRHKEAEERERKEYIARDKRARKSVAPRPRPRPPLSPEGDSDSADEIQEETTKQSAPSGQKKRFFGEPADEIELVALGAKGGQIVKRAADLRRVEKSIEIPVKPRKKISVPELDETGEDESPMVVEHSPSSSFNEDISVVEALTQSVENLTVRTCSYPNKDSGRLDATAWRSVDGEYGCIMQCCFCCEPSEDITKSDTINQFRLNEQELITEKKIGTSCCAPYRSSTRGTKICGRILEPNEQDQLRYLPQTAVLGFFCRDHLSLLSQHQVCPFCNEFYENENRDFLVCRAVEGEEHLYHLACRSRMTMLRQCPHCLHDVSNSVEEWYTGPRKSPPRVRTKLCGQKDRHLFPDQQLTSVQLPSFRADDGLVLFSGYIPEDELKILRSREGISNTLSNNRTELLVKVLKVFQDSKCHKEMSEEILVECLAYLHDCAKHNGVLSMVHLFKMGCDINAADGSGLTPLIVATIYDQCAVLHALVALGADVNLQDAEGRTTLHWAAKKKNPRLMSYLLKHGADPKLLDKEGFVATFWTLSWISYTDFQDLTTLAIDLQSLDKEHWSLLHWAVYLFRNDLAVFFLDLGLVSLPDMWGDTPVHIAVRVGNVAFVQLLLTRHSPLMISAENHLGLKPHDLAGSLLINYSEQDLEIDERFQVALGKMMSLMQLFDGDESKHTVHGSESNDVGKGDGKIRGDVCGDISGGRNYSPIPCFNFKNGERYGKDPLIYSNIVVRSLVYQNKPTPIDWKTITSPCKLDLKGKPGHCLSPKLCDKTACGLRCFSQSSVRVQPEMVNGCLVPVEQAEAFCGGLIQNAAAQFDGKRPPTTAELSRLVHRLSAQAALRPDLRDDLRYVIKLAKVHFSALKSSTCIDEPFITDKLPDVIQKKNGGLRLRSSSVSDFRSNKGWTVSWKSVRMQKDKAGDRSYTMNPGYKMDLFRELEKASCEMFLKNAIVRFERSHPLERWDMSHYTRKARRRHPPWQADARIDDREVWSAAPRFCDISKNCSVCEEGRQEVIVETSSYPLRERDRIMYDVSDRHSLEGCSVLCDCDESCPQRATQWPSTARLALFYVNEKVKWGVMALSKITPGQFLAEYTGELIRGNLYGNDTYMYELASLTAGGKDGRNDEYDTEDEGSEDEGSEDEGSEQDMLWVVDAKSVGNISRFFNHSCKPSARTIEVLEHGTVIPRLCVFAIAEVHPGQQITLDYGANWWKVKNKRERAMLCQCLEETCKYNTPGKIKASVSSQDYEETKKNKPRQGPKKRRNRKKWST